MDKLKVLVLGNGLLGGEIVKQTGWEFVSRKTTGFDINDLEKSLNTKLIVLRILIHILQIEKNTGMLIIHLLAI